MSRLDRNSIRSEQKYRKESDSTQNAALSGAVNLLNGDGQTGSEKKDDEERCYEWDCCKGGDESPEGGLANSLDRSSDSRSCPAGYGTDTDLEDRVHQPESSPGPSSERHGLADQGLWRKHVYAQPDTYLRLGARIRQ